MRKISEIEKIIKKLALKGKISLKKHCVIRMVERDISVDNIITALKTSEILKIYPDDRPLVSYLVLGYYDKDKPLHLIIAIDKNNTLLWVITIYVPDIKIWSSNFKERK